MFARQLSMYFQALQRIVCVTFCSHLMSSTMVVVELRGDIQRAIPIFVKCLKDLNWYVCKAAIDVLSNLTVHCMCYLLFPFDVLNHDCSRIAWRYSKSHSYHCGMSEGFELVCLPCSHQCTFKPCGASYVVTFCSHLMSQT